MDPCFPTSVGTHNVERMLVDLNVKIQLTGSYASRLSPGTAYVIFGCTAPVRYDDDVFGVHIPSPSPRAGVAKVLGATLPRRTGVPCRQDVVDTQPFRVIVPGDDLSEGSSGVILMSGHFVPLRQPTSVQTWRDWLRTIEPQIDFHLFAVVCKDTYFDGDLCCDPGQRYVFRMVQKVIGQSIACVSGFVDMRGSFVQVPAPTAPCTWQNWIKQWFQFDPNLFWATLDGKPISEQHVLLPQYTYLLRLRCRGRGGGGKEARAKLAQHLSSKGVPASMVEARIKDIMAIISDDQLIEVYKTLEPWAALKNLVSNRVRLVTTEEMRA